MKYIDYHKEKKQHIVGNYIRHEDDDEKELTPIPGSPPDLLNPPKGCPFVDRCTKAMRVCKDHMPSVTTFSDTHQCACWLNHSKAVK